MLPQRLTMITLGVADMGRARAFYERLGFKRAGFPSDSVTFYDMNGVVLGLYGMTPLAEDANVPATNTSGFRGTAVALNLATEAEVDAALAHAASIDAQITKPAQTTDWGGYSGYFADPDGHLWEIAYNPHAPLDDNGHMPLPPPQPLPENS